MLRMRRYLPWICTIITTTITCLYQPVCAGLPKSPVIFRNDTTSVIIPAGSLSHAAISLETNKKNGDIEKLGWDTEGTGREKINLLKSPVLLRMSKGKDSLTVPAQFHRINAYTVKYDFALPKQQFLSWEVTTVKGKMNMRISTSGDVVTIIDKVEVVFPFDPATAVTSIISGHWEKGKFFTPAILSAPDLGQLLVSCKEIPSLQGRMEGSRGEKWIRTIFELVPVRGTAVYNIEFAPVILPMPQGYANLQRWEAARRGWFNLIQQSCGASGGNINVHGVWANNALSDPVSSLVYLLGDATLLVPELAPGVLMKDILKHTLSYWINDKTNDEGLVTYTARGTAGREQQPDDATLEKINPGDNQNVMDANPSVLIGAWCYMAVAKDDLWLQQHIGQLEFIAQYMIRRDTDNDGIMESKQSGNSGSRLKYRNPDCAFDCYSSGHKNAYVNILAYRAWNAMAALEKQLGRYEKMRLYLGRAEKLKKAFVKTFYNPASGWLGWWKSEDGVLHDINTDVATSMAIVYGLLDENAGKKMLQQYWAALEATGFKRFDLGVPLNIKPVPREDMEHYSAFQQFLNGGCTVFNTAVFIDALYTVGMTPQADMILDRMLHRQQSGAFANGGGFQNGFVDKMGYGAEVFDWSGNPAGYEGHLIYNWSFLHSVLYREPSFRRLRNLSQ